MKVGITTYALSWCIGIPGQPGGEGWTHDRVLDAAIEAGAEKLQFCENLPLTDLPDQDAARLIGRARSAGIALELGMRGMDRAEIIRNLKRSRELGADLLRLVIHAGGVPATPEQILAALSPLRSHAEGEGVRIAVENHDHLPREALLRIVEDLGPWFGITYDTANSLGCLESPVETLRTLAGRVLSFHAKDVRLDRVPSMMGFIVSGTVAGEGMIPMERLIQEAWTRGRRPDVLLEHWFQPVADGSAARNEAAALAPGIAFLKSIRDRVTAQQP